MTKVVHLQFIERKEGIQFNVPRKGVRVGKGPYVEDDRGVLRVGGDDRVASETGERSPAAGRDELFDRLALVETFDVAWRTEMGRDELAEERRQRVGLLGGSRVRIN